MPNLEVENNARISSGIRNDAGGDLAGADGDAGPLQFDSLGRLRVVTAGAAGGTSAIDDASFAPGVDSGTPAMGFADEVAPDSVGEGDVGVFRMSLNRNLYTQIRDGLSNERGAAVDASNRLSAVIQGTAGDPASSRLSDGAAFYNTLADSQLPAALVGGRLDVNVGASLLAQVEDAVHGTGDTGVMSLAVRNDAGGALAADGAYIPLITDSAGRLRVVTQGGAGGTSAVDDSMGTLGANPGVDIGDVTVNNAGAGAAVNIQDGGNIITVDGTVVANAGTGNFNVVGTETNDSVAPGTDNLGTLPGVATAAAPSYTEGNQVAVSQTLTGDTRITLDGEGVNIIRERDTRCGHGSERGRHRCHRGCWNLRWWGGGARPHTSRWHCPLRQVSWRRKIL